MVLNGKRPWDITSLPIRWVERFLDVLCNPPFHYFAHVPATTYYPWDYDSSSNASVKREGWCYPPNVVSV